MSHGVFIVSLTLLAIVVAVALYFGIRLAGRPGEEPTEHGDGEP